MDDVKKADLQYIEDERQGGENNAVDTAVQEATTSCATYLQRTKGGERLIGFVMEGLKAIEEGKNVSKFIFATGTPRTSREDPDSFVDDDTLDAEVEKIFRVSTRSLEYRRLICYNLLSGAYSPYRPMIQTVPTPWISRSCRDSWQISVCL